MCGTTRSFHFFAGVRVTGKRWACPFILTVTAPGVAAVNSGTANSTRRSPNSFPDRKLPLLRRSQGNGEALGVSVYFNGDGARGGGREFRNRELHAPLPEFLSRSEASTSSPESG